MKLKNMKLAIVVMALAAAAAVLADEPKTNDPVALGKQLVGEKHCSLCHQIDGRGGHSGKPMYEYADKTDVELKAGLLDPKKTIGPSTKMPSYKDKLTDDEIQAVIAYIKTLKKP